MNKVLAGLVLLFSTSSANADITLFYICGEFIMLQDKSELYYVEDMTDQDADHLMPRLMGSEPKYKVNLDPLFPTLVCV